MTPSDHDIPPDDACWERYLTDECSAAERARVEAWLRQHPDTARLTASLAADWRDAAATPRPFPPQFDVAGMRSRFWARVHAASGTASSTASSTASHATTEAVDSTAADVVHRDVGAHGVATGWRRGMLRAATSVAGIAGVAIVCAIVWLGVGRRDAAHLRSHPLIYATANGERATVTFPDGSTAILNVGSRLEVPANYTAGHRVLRLVGEAFFTVTPNTDAPFTVTTGNVTSRVLGTSFAVRRYPTDSATNVAVRDGKVAVQSVVVTASQQTTVTRDHVPVVMPISMNRFAFTTGTLALDGQPMTQAIPELDRWYNAEILLGDSAAARTRIGGQFPAGSITDLQELLEMTLRVRIERHGRVLTLYAGRAK